MRLTGHGVVDNWRAAAGTTHDRTAAGRAGDRPTGV